MSTREAVLAGVVNLLAAPGTFTVVRNEVTPANVGPGGHVVVRDGQQISADRDLGLPRWYVTHRIDIEALAGGGDPDLALDTLTESVRDALAVDPTISGTAAYWELELQEIETIGEEGAAAVKAALFGLTVEYVATEPLD